MVQAVRGEKCANDRRFDDSAMKAAGNPSA
jgi:hypothetical protein